MLDLPHRYETLLDRMFSGGQKLSRGQWQRLAAALAFYRDAALLICDEPSAALDARPSTHEQLVALGGRYAELFALQAAGYRDGQPPEPVPAQPAVQ